MVFWFEQINTNLHSIFHLTRKNFLNLRTKPVYKFNTLRSVEIVMALNYFCYPGLRTELLIILRNSFLSLNLLTVSIRTLNAQLLDQVTHLKLKKILTIMWLFGKTEQIHKRTTPHFHSKWPWVKNQSFWVKIVIMWICSDLLKGQIAVRYFSAGDKSCDAKVN